jgi:hypothetical protein
LMIGFIGLVIGIIFINEGNAYTISIAAILAITALIINLIGVVLAIMIQ